MWRLKDVCILQTVPELFSPLPGSYATANLQVRSGREFNVTLTQTRLRLGTSRFLCPSCWLLGSRSCSLVPSLGNFPNFLYTCTWFFKNPDKAAKPLSVVRVRTAMSLTWSPHHWHSRRTRTIMSTPTPSWLFPQVERSQV